MIKLPGIKNLPVADKKVLLRTNYDIPLTADGALAGETRIKESLPTIKHLIKQKARVIIISHFGRPGGETDLNLSLKPIAERIEPRLSVFRTGEFNGWRLNQQLVLLENLRFWPGEEKNDLEFAKKLARLADFYVNEAFACSHRKHASIVGLPGLFPVSKRALGLDFLEEVKVLSKIREKPKRPVVLILGGAKKDKMVSARKHIRWVDWLLVGGRMVEYDGFPHLLNHPKIVGSLIKNDQDITMETGRKFAQIISRAKTVVWAGPMGNFYDKKYEKGTRMVAEAVIKSKAFTAVGGGDTEVALNRFKLRNKIDFICSGGGAMLKFLAEGTLPGIEAIKND